MRLTKPIKCFFFDLAGTLCFPATSHWIFPKIAEGLINLESINYIPITRFNTAYNSSIGFLNKNRLAKTTEDEYETFLAFYSILADYLPEFELSSDKVRLIAHDKVYNDENIVFFDDAYDTLNRLSKDYRLGVIADAWPSCIRNLKAANLYDFFSSVTLSCDFGACAPNQAMFEQALSSIDGLCAGESVLVDDSKDNLISAGSFGMQPVLSNTKSKSRDDDFPTIFSLFEIFEHI